MWEEGIFQKNEREEGIQHPCHPSPPTVSADTDQPSTESATSVSSTTNISDSVDAAWQCRGSGRSYQSLSGHSSVIIIGEKAGKVLKFATRKKSCRFCEAAERCGRPAPKHDCRKNCTGSAKAMESSMAVELLKGQPGDNFKISKVTSDLDSMLNAHLKKEIGRIIERKLDRNHLSKTLTTHLH